MMCAREGNPMREQLVVGRRSDPRSRTIFNNFSKFVMAGLVPATQTLHHHGPRKRATQWASVREPNQHLFIGASLVTAQTRGDWVARSSRAMEAKGC